MIGCFVGIILLNLAKSKDGNGQKAKAFGSYTLGISLAVITAISYSTAAVIIRKIKNVHFSIVNFHYGWIAFLLMFAALVIEYEISDQNDQ